MPLALLLAVGCSTEMPFDGAADFAAGVCASAIKPAHDRNISPMREARDEFISLPVFALAPKSRRINYLRSKAARVEDALSAVLQLRCAGRACSVNTTEDLSIRFDAVADGTAIALGTIGLVVTLTLRREDTQ